jgi:hypothetical protein
MLELPLFISQKFDIRRMNVTKTNIEQANMNALNFYITMSNFSFSRCSVRDTYDSYEYDTRTEAQAAFVWKAESSYI